MMQSRLKKNQLENNNGVLTQRLHNHYFLQMDPSSAVSQTCIESLSLRGQI